MNGATVTQETPTGTKICRRIDVIRYDIFAEICETFLSFDKIRDIFLSKCLLVSSDTTHPSGSIPPKNLAQKAALAPARAAARRRRSRSPRGAQDAGQGPDVRSISNPIIWKGDKITSKQILRDSFSAAILG